MPKHVKFNVVDHRVIDNGLVCEDISSFTLPTLEHPTTSIEGISGMVMDIDMPNVNRLNAMELTIEHNNGINCRNLGTPGRHTIECRAVRQDYAVADGDLGHEAVKFRFIAVHKSTDKGSFKIGDPYGSSEKYSVIRYEEEVAGEVITIVDATAGILRFNGTDYAKNIADLMD